MKRLILEMVVFAFMFGACSLNKEGESATRELGVYQTGDPATDSALQYVSEYDLQVTGLSEGTDLLENGVNVSFTGPLNDRRAVRGGRIKIYASVFQNDSVSNLTVIYGEAPDTLNMTLKMSNTGLGHFDAVLSVERTVADRLYFKIVDRNGNVYLDKSGGLFVIPVYDSIVSYGYGYDFSSRNIAFWLTLNYAGKDMVSNTVLHYGWNNWQNVRDTNMTFHGDYASTTIPVPADAIYFDFAVNKAGVWDNNHGKDFHQSVKPFVNIYPYRVGRNEKGISMTLANTGLKDNISVRYGHDGWSKVTDTSLYANYYNGSFLGFWSGSFTIPISSKVLDFAFHDEYNNWENNFGMDWHVDVDYVKY